MEERQRIEKWSKILYLTNVKQISEGDRGLKTDDRRRREEGGERMMEDGRGKESKLEKRNWGLDNDILGAAPIDRAQRESKN